MISAEAKHYSNKIAEDLFTLRARKKGRGWANRSEDTVAKLTQGELAELLAKAFESGASKKVEEYESTLNVIARWGEGADKLSSRWDETFSILAARVLRKMGGVPSEGEDVLAHLTESQRSKLSEMAERTRRREGLDTEKDRSGEADSMPHLRCPRSKELRGGRQVLRPCLAHTK